jgi:hypothetical protein
MRARIIMQSTPNLSEADINQALRQLEDKIPPLTAEEVRVGFENSLLWYYHWWRENGGQPTRKELIALLENLENRTADFENGFILPND